MQQPGFVRQQQDLHEQALQLGEELFAKGGNSVMVWGQIARKEAKGGSLLGAGERWGLLIQRMGRYWSRDGRTELDIVAELDSGAFLFGECKWSANTPVGLSVYASLKAKVHTLPEAKWRQEAVYILFAVGGFAPDLRQLAAQPAERLYLVDGTDLLPTGSTTKNL